jgi:hypothetical protein
MSKSQIANRHSPSSILHSPSSILHSLPRHWEWIFTVALLLLAWGLRLAWLEAIPPGWRDDDLIEMFALAGEVLAGHPTLYFTGASGHEPLYHTLRAGVLALVGINSVGAHLLSISSGVLTVPLTYVLCRRLFGWPAALLAAALLTFSFWSLMYSRFGLRHQAVVPPTLATFYLLWSMDRPSRNIHRLPWGAGVCLAAALYTYTASRLLPIILAAFGCYLALVHREQFRRWWRPLLVMLLVAAALTVPLWVAIAQGRSEAAAQGIGADARVAELAVPLRELRVGNPRPLLENVWTTLGMFHAIGDPEWLYNIPDRPVFNLFGGILFWAGVALCLYRWRQPRYFFLLLWLGVGLLPAFVSVPPASLSHTILVQPVAYILPALALTEAYRWSKLQTANCRSANRQIGKSANPQIANRKSQIANYGSPIRRFADPQIRHSPFAIRPFVHSFIRSFADPRIRHSLLFIVHCSLFIFLLATNGIRDLRDYFIVWPQRGMVRFLYRADYREAARYLDAHPEITDVAISSALLGPWDRLALDVDVRHDDVAVRLFNPERALVWVNVLLTSSPHPAAPIEDFLKASATPPQAISPYLTLYTFPPISNLQSPTSNPLAHFANGLELIETRWVNGTFAAPGQEAVLLTAWRVAAPLDLPPLPIVANPPPPGVYSGPRLAVFAHVLAADGTFLAGDDGLWVDPLTLQPGDWFIQVHYLDPSPGAPGGPYTLEMGLYDPLTGDRWPVMEANGQPGPDHFSISIEGEP